MMTNGIKYTYLSHYETELMYKRYLCLVLSSLLLSACSSDSDDNTSNAPYPKTQVGVAVSAIETAAYRDGFYNHAKSIGESQSNLAVIVDQAGNDQAVQEKQIEDMKNKGAKALVINLVDISKGADLVNRYCGQLPMVFFNRSPGEKVLANCEKAYFVDGDPAQAGVLQGLEVLKNWSKNPQWDKNKDGKIQFAIVKGIPGHFSGKARSQWAIGTMENYPSLGVPVQEIMSDFGLFQTTETKNVANRWVANPNFSQVEVILANNDTMALAVVDVLKEKNIKLPVFGIDASADGLEAVKRGDLVATVFNDYQAQTATALRMASNLAADLPVDTNLPYKLDYKTVYVPFKEASNTAQEDKK